MVVDDNLSNLKMISNALSECFAVHTAASAAAMFKMLTKVPDIALILLDVDMPEMDGYETCKTLKANSETVDIPVIFLTGKIDMDSETYGLELGAVDYIRKPFNPILLAKRVKLHIESDRQKKELRDKNSELLNEINQFNEAFVTGIADLIESRDGETGGHVHRTEQYIRCLLDNIDFSGSQFLEKLTEVDVDVICKASQLHDVGKIAIPDNILHKPGKLTKEEFDIMKQHSLSGKQIIDKLAKHINGNVFLEYSCIIAVSHHEKWDGTGYPYGLKGNDIPFLGRVMAIADVYDALISPRVYKDRMTHEQAKEIIVSESGTHFDPDLVEVFIKVEPLFKNIAKSIIV